MSSKHIFISAGELSGDLHGGKLITEIRRQQPGIRISAIGGDTMNSAGAELLYHIRETSFMGFAEVIRHLPFIFTLWKQTIKHIDTNRPDLAVMIDYPGFNLRLARALTRRRIPVVYYISPQVWAWHQARVKKIRKYTRLVLCILPFEEKWLQAHRVRARFVGHPLKDQISQTAPPAESPKRITPADATPLIGLFPGSRQQEVRRHLPVMLEAVSHLKRRYPDLHAAISIAPDIDISTFKKAFRHEWIHQRRNSSHQIIREADLVIMSSGTATLEATLLRTPLIVIYRLSGLSYLLGKILIRVPYISLSNLIANRQGISEFIQHNATARNIAAEAEKLLSDREYRTRMLKFMSDVDAKLGPPGTSERAARLILNLL